MKKCEICWKGCDIEHDGHCYCAEDFVQYNIREVVLGLAENIKKGRKSCTSETAKERILQQVEKKYGQKN